MPPPAFLTGVLSGFIKRAAESRLLARQDQEAQDKKETDILSELTKSDNPDISHAAITGLLDIASGQKKPKGGYLARLMGPNETTIHPAVTSMMQLIKGGTRTELPAPTLGSMSIGQAPTPSSTPSGTIPTPPPAAGAAAMPPPPNKPGGGITPPTGGVQVGAPPDLQPVPNHPDTTLPAGPPLQFGSTGRPAGPPTVIRTPTHIFDTPEEKAIKLSRAKSQGDVEGEVAGLVAAGFTDEEARGLVKDKYQRTLRGGAGTIQSVQGDLPDGTPAFGLLDKRPSSPTFGRYINPDTDEVLIGFKPRAQTSSVSMGADREAAATRLFRKRYGQLTPAEAKQADDLAIQTNAQGVGADTTARGVAEANVPLSTGQRFNATTGLQQDWRKLEAPFREMQRQYQLMQTGLSRFTAGDKIGGSQAVLVTFQKILDPSSVVRESEYARTPEGLGFFQRLQGWVERLQAGGAGVPEEELGGMVETARQFVAGMTTWNALEGQRIDETSRRYGIDPALIRGGSPGGPPAPVSGGAPSAGGPPPAGPGGIGVGTFVGAGDPLPPRTVVKRTTDPATGETILLATVGAKTGEVQYLNGHYYWK